jgi:hypothetical protein
VTTDGHLEEEIIPKKNTEILPSNVVISGEIIECDEHNQQRQSESDIENVNLLFNSKYSVLIFNEN